MSAIRLDQSDFLILMSSIAGATNSTNITENYLITFPRKMHVQSLKVQI